MKAAVEFRSVDIVFGERSGDEALRLLDEGKDRQAILEATGCVIGVAGATLTVPECEICVLMGLSGSGKSSLLRAINGLNKVTRGQVLVADGDRMVDVASCDPNTLQRIRRHRVAMVFQQFALLPWRTVAENVAFGLELRGVAPDEQARIVEDKLKLVRLDKWAGKFADELSGGMQQRVGLARAYATDADILLMDEPFSALDPLIRTHLQDELLELQRSFQRTIIFVSHDLDEALKIGNKIVIMEGGRIIQVGTPEEIVTNPANQYVANFVAHVNPLNVLRGVTLMTAVDDLPRRDGQILVDKYGTCAVTLDDAGHPRRAVLGEETPIAIQPIEASPSIGSIATASQGTSIRRLIETREATRLPVLLLDDAGRFVGKVGEHEIVHGLLRRDVAKSA